MAEFGDLLRQLGTDLQSGQHGSQTPSAIQEYMYWSRLPDDQKQQYLGIKRAQQVVNLGGTQGVLNPIVGGGLQQEFAVTPKPEQLPDFQAQQEAAKKSAQISVENADAIRKAGENTATNLAAFDELKLAAKNAPSGLISNALASGSNIAGVGSESAVAQGNFTVKRAAAENAIRQTFRVSGSGSQSDSDAKPFIQMLPDVNDSEAVKISKTNAAVEAMKTKASTIAREKGLPDPFAAPAPTSPPTLTREAIAAELARRNAQ
jgi:hypothetical protein